MNDRERILSQSLKRIELVAWSGTVDALALRLNMRTDKLIEALGRVASERRRSFQCQDRRGFLFLSAVAQRNHRNHRDRLIPYLSPSQPYSSTNRPFSGWRRGDGWPLRRLAMRSRASPITRCI